MTAVLERHVEHEESDLPAVHRDLFVSAMGSAASTVTVVTTDGPSGRCGRTVSSFCSLSADRPLACLRRGSPLCGALEVNQRFSINVRSEEQLEIAHILAGRPCAGNPYDFNSIDWTSDVLGRPALPDATVSFNYQLDVPVIRGSHFIYIGRVVWVGPTPSSSLSRKNVRTLCAAHLKSN